jgi:pimeloyl-ACP methyl ester carboxylesterase
MQIVINDILTNYTKLGEGRVIVLVHGWGDDGQTFNQLQSELSTKFRVYTLDLPGFGSSSMPQTSWKLVDFAEFIKSFLMKLGENKVYCFIGHSNGGAILIKGLAEGLIQSDKLVLISSSGIRNVDRIKKNTIKLVAKTGKLFVRVLPNPLQSKIKTKFYKVVGSDADVSPQMLETFKNIVKDDVQADCSKLNDRTLLIYGSNDQVTPVEFGKTFNQLIKGSKLVVISGGDHFVHQQKFTEVYKEIGEFLNV